jgi:benzoate membrane transport protein
MIAHIERPTERPPDFWQAASDFGLLYASNGLVSWLFAVSAPVAIILAVGSNGGLAENAIASWIFGVFFINGLITILLSWYYRQPLVMLWTIPGAVLVGQSFNHLTFSEIVGAYYGTSALMFLLGATGWVKRAMVLMPMPIVMGMVAGVFLRFGLDLVHAILTDTAMAGPMVAIWLLLTAFPQLGRRYPPIIGALLAGALATFICGRFDASAPLHFEVH